MTNTPSFAHQARDYIQNKYPQFKPTIGVVLGSGLGDFVSQLENPQTISYEALPGFPKMTVVGHSGSLTLGYINNVGVICVQGRAHSYEGNKHEAVKTYVRTLKLLGCEYFIATNASGSLREEAGPGELMLISDHINFQPGNPLAGPNDDEFGPRFLPLDDAYNLEMRNQFLNIAKNKGIKLHQGVYIAVLGPNYETAAEIRAFKMWGADAVGMSTVPEVLIARHCGMKVAVIATLTNYATGLARVSHSHDEVVKMAGQAGKNLNILLKEYILTLMPHQH